LRKEVIREVVPLKCSKITCCCYGLKGNNYSDVLFSSFWAPCCKLQRTNDIIFHNNIFTVLMQFCCV